MSDSNDKEPSDDKGGQDDPAKKALRDVTVNNLLAALDRAEEIEVALRVLAQRIPLPEGTHQLLFDVAHGGNAVGVSSRS